MSPAPPWQLTLILVFATAGSALAEPAPDPAAHAIAREIAAWRGGLHAVLGTIEAQPQIFPRARVSEPRLLSPEGRELARSLWAAFADLLLAIEQSERRLEASRPGIGDADAFALRRAAFLARYRFALDFIERVERDPSLDILFDEPHPAIGLPDRSYARLKLHYLNVGRASEFAAIELLHRTRGAITPEPLRTGADEDARRILALGRGTGPRLTAVNAARVVGDMAFAAWLPAQERVARWAGDVRVRRNGDALISGDQIRELQPQLEPGDILLQRREWYLTNAGIPGFWTHAALYVGTPEERERFFDDPEVRAFAATFGQASLESLLRARHPHAHAASGVPDAGHPARVLEAIATGVSFTALEHSAGADSLAVVRPRLSKRERAIALVRAFGYAGRPYDYEFDFGTDAALVCSELVYKSYQPGTGTRGLELPLATVGGRLMLTPTEIARRFEQAAPDTHRLDFVLMLDGSERTDRAHPVAEEVFAASWRRPKWHIVVAAPPDSASR